MNMPNSRWDLVDTNPETWRLFQNGYCCEINRGQVTKTQFYGYFNGLLRFLGDDIEDIKGKLEQAVRSAEAEFKAKIENPKAKVEKTAAKGAKAKN